MPIFCPCPGPPAGRETVYSVAVRQGKPNIARTRIEYANAKNRKIGKSEEQKTNTRHGIIVNDMKARHGVSPLTSALLPSGINAHAVARPCPGHFSGSALSLGKAGGALGKENPPSIWSITE